jgi:acetylornithine/succinyldiaminopimelate/putrescine aminotransferase
VAAVIMEPVQNAGGCFTPARGLLAARARDLRRVRRAARSPTR